MSASMRRAALFGGAGCLVIALLCASLWAFTGPDAGQLNYKIYNKKTVMTFAYKAYASERAADGKYWLARLVLDNPGGRPLKDVRISYRIPDMMDWTTPDRSAELAPGQTAVFPIYPKFPTKVTYIRSRTPATLELKIAYKDTSGNVVEKVEKREFEFRGINEIEYTSLPDTEIVDWYDMFSNNELVAAFVTDEDEVVKQYLGKISEQQGGVNIISDQKTLLQFLKSCYDFEVATGMKYTAAKGVPERIGDTTAIVQSVRLPRDVINQNSGLCIELAILQASLAQAAGAKAFLVLIPGHCYPLIQASDGSMVAIESTGIGGSNLGGTMSFEEAIKTGMKEFQQVTSGQTPACIIDVGLQHSRGLRPPELERADIGTIAKLIADRIPANKNDGQMVLNRQNQPGQDNNLANNNNNNNGGNMAAAVFRGQLAAVPYPPNFVPNPAAVAQIRQVAPFYSFAASDPTQTTSMDIFEFPSSDPGECMAAILMLGGQLGIQYNVSDPQTISVGGQKAVSYPFVANSAMSGQFQGQLILVPTQRGTLGVGICGRPGSTEWMRVGQSVVAGTKFGGGQ